MLAADLPGNTASKTADDLREQNLFNPEDALKYVPNTSIRKRYIGDRHSMIGGRGFGTLQPSCALAYVDGYRISNFLGRFDGPRAVAWPGTTLDHGVAQHRSTRRVAHAPSKLPAKAHSHPLFVQPRSQGETMFTKHSLVIAASIVALGGVAHAQTTVKDPWVRGTVPTQKASGAFMNVTSASGGKLVSVSSSVAGVAEIHEMAMDGNVMKMRAVPGLELPAGKAVELKPGGYHVMLMDLKQQLKPGETVLLTLTIEGKDGKRETVDVKAPVKPLAAPGHDMKH